MTRFRVGSLTLALLLGGTSAVLAQTQAQKISGEVVLLEGSRLEVKSTNGQALTIKLADKARFSARSPADLATITAGSFIGTTAVPQADGTLLASEVRVFPESMRGTGEGHRPMDNEPGNTMTNATVTGIAAAGVSKPRDTMTNATVANVAVAQNENGKRLTLTYKGGEKVVFVPDGIPIMMTGPGDRSLLVPGAHVVVYAAKQHDGVLVAERVSVGTKGYVPPL